MARPSTPLLRVARVLDALAVAPDGLGLSQVAERAGLPLATAHRLLHTLRGIGYVQGEGGRNPWCLGPRFLRLVQYSLAPEQVASLAGPVLQSLVDDLGHVAFLARLGEQGVELVATLFPDDRPASLVHPGRSFPVHATASGKAIYAYRPEPVLATALAGPLERYTPATVTEAACVRRELARVRRQGFAESDEEMDPGVYAIACPVEPPAAGVLHALAVVDLKPRFYERCTRDGVVARLRAGARVLAGAMAAP